MAARHSRKLSLPSFTVNRWAKLKGDGIDDDEAPPEENMLSAWSEARAPLVDAVSALRVDAVSAPSVDMEAEGDVERVPAVPCWRAAAVASVCAAEVMRSDGGLD